MSGRFSARSHDPRCDDLVVTDQPGAPTGPVLTARSFGRRVELAFSEYQPMDDYVGEYLVFASAEGLQVRSPVVTSLGGDNLSGFAYGLAQDFRGWPGPRRWRSLEDQLSIEATWHNRGHVNLRFGIRPSIYDSWTLSVDVQLEAGEEMQRFGEELQAFFTT
jgi:hypothetical protein